MFNMQNHFVDSFSELYTQNNHYQPDIINNQENFHPSLDAKGKININNKNSNKIFNMKTNAANNNKSNLKRETENLPRTLATRKGALILFSEEFSSKSDKNSRNYKYLGENSTLSFSEMPIKTVNELQKNVLFYGLEESDQYLAFNDKFNKSESNIMLSEKGEINRRISFNEQIMPFSTFSILNMSTKNILNNFTNSKNNLDYRKNAVNMKDSDYTNNEEIANDDDIKAKRINRGFSARHYLRSLTKNWDQKLLDTFISDGKISKQNIYEKNLRLSKKKRIEEDLSLWPQAYKFDNSWVHATIDMKSYKFIKAQEFYSNKYNKNENGESNIHINNKTKLIHEDPIKIFDQKLTEVSYKALNFFEKQKVLTELLFQSALNNLKRHKIDFSDNLDLKDSKINFHSNDFPILIKEPTNLSSSFNKKKAVINNSFTAAKSQFESKSQPRFDLKSSQKRMLKTRTAFSTNYEPVYMFGKYSGAPWVKANQKIHSTKTESKPKEETKTPFGENNDEKLITSSSMDKLDLANEECQNRFENFKNEAETENHDELHQLNLNGNNVIIQENELNTNDDAVNKLLVTTGNEIDLNINIETNMNQDEIDEELNKFADNLDHLLSFGNMLESDDKLTTIEIAMEELKSINGSEQFVLKDSRSSFRRDEKEYDANREISENEKKTHEISEKRREKIIDGNFLMEKLENQSNNRKLYRNNVNLEKFKQQKIRDMKRDLINESVASDRSKIEPNNQREKETNTIHISNNLNMVENYMNLEKKHKSPIKQKTNNIDLIFKEKNEPLPQFKKSFLNNDSNEYFEESVELKKLSSSLDRVYKDNLNNNYFKRNRMSNNLNHHTNISRLQSRHKPNFDDNLVMLPEINKDPTLPDIKSREKKTQLNNHHDHNDDNEYAKVEMLKLNPKTTEYYNNTENLKKKMGFDNRKMLVKRADVEITSNKLTNYFNKETLVEPVVSEKEPSKSSFAKEMRKNQATSIKNESFKFNGPIYDRIENTDSNSFADYYKPKLSNMFEKNSMKGKNIDWACGNFDPRHCFVIWSYNPPIVIDKEFAECLKKYAKLIAKTALGNKNSGKSLSDDLRRALIANLEKLKEAIEQGKIGREVIEEYKKVFKQMLAKTLRRKDLQNIVIENEMLVKLLELPPHAFEIFVDPITGLNKLRIRPSFLEEQSKLIRTVVTEKNLTLDDFDVVIDPLTGKEKVRLKSDVARKLGIPNGSEDLIEIFTDEKGNQMLRLKDGVKSVKIGDTEYELAIDPNTGQYVLKMTNKQKVGEETLEDIMRLAANMSPETRHRYFQELLKTSGDSMSENLRKNLITEMINNANNLAPETRDNLLKDLMVNLVNTLPPDLAKKVLGDIMKSTNTLHSAVKEQMIKNLLQDLDELPPVLKEKALFELIKNMDDLSSEIKHQFLNEILNKADDLGDSIKIDDELKNQVLKEIVKNSQNLDEESRKKIIQQVLNGTTEMSADLLEELVKQMDKLPDELRDKLMDKIKKNIENGGLESGLLAELLKNPDNLSSDLLASIVNQADKLNGSTLKELMKNLDKLPDQLKKEMFIKMAENLNSMDDLAKKELLKELMTNPSLIKDEKLREKLMKDIVSGLAPNDILKDIENMNADEKNRYLQDLLKQADNLSDDARKKIIELLLDNAQNLDQEARDNLLKDLVENVIKDLPSEVGSKLLSEIMKSTENLDSSLKQNMINNLLTNVDLLPPELKQQTLQEVIQNLNGFSAQHREEILKKVLENADSLPSELRDHTFKVLLNNLDNLSSEQKNQFLQNILDKVEKTSGESEFAQKLKNEVLKEIVKNSKDLDEETRSKVLKTVIEKFKADNGIVPDVLLDELVKQINSMPDEIKNAVMSEVKKNIEKGKINQVLNNLKNMPKELVEQLVSNLNEMKPDLIKELVKNLDQLPEDIKSKAIGQMIDNIKTLDPDVQKDLLNQLISNPSLIKDKKMLDKAIYDIVANLDQMPNDIKKDVLKNIAKNISKLSNDAKQKVIKEVLSNLKDSNEETREDVLKNLLKNMSQKELEDWIKKSDISDELKQKMLNELNQIINNGENMLNSDDEKQLVGLTGEERIRKKRSLIERKKVEKDKTYVEEEKTKWQDTLRNLTGEKKDLNWLKNTKNKVLKDKSRENSILNEDQIDFIKAFNQLSEEEKAKLIESMNREERYALNKLQDEYARLRQKELEDALLEAKRAAIAKLREELARKQKLQYINFLRIEANMFNHTQQISRAFVFSYFDLLGWLDCSME